MVAQLSRAAEPEPEPSAERGPVVAVYTGGYLPYLTPAPRPGGDRRAVTDPGLATFEDLADRQPGSLFPVRSRRSVSSSD